MADKSAIADAVNEDIDWRDVRDVGVGPVLDALAVKGYVVVRRDDLHAILAVPNVGAVAPHRRLEWLRCRDRLQAALEGK